MISLRRTKVGASFALALILVGAAVAFRFFSTSRQSDLEKKVAIIALESVKNSKMDLPDPLEAIAGSSTDAVSGISAVATSSSNENITATDRFARELFTLYAEAKKNGQSIDEVTSQKIADLVLSNDYSGEKKLLTASDLKISTDTSYAAAKAYGNTLGLQVSIPQVKGDQELVILERIREQGIHQDDVDTLARILTRYRTIEKGLKAVKVPKAAVNAHLDLVNGIGFLVDAVEGILTLESDPVGSLAKIKGYEDGFNLLNAGVLGVRDFLVSNKVSFSSGESGNILLR